MSNRARNLWLLLGMITLLALPLRAQDADSENVALGGLITGEITNHSPRAVYHFDGRRGERVSIRLTATSGTLDPVLSIFDNTGQLLLSRDDTDGSQNVEVTLTLNKNDRYFIVVGRFGYSLGSTTGQYELALERVGILSEPGSTLRYGDSVFNRITNMEPQIYYTFQANQGDIVNIEMVRNSGNLDPYLQVVNSQNFVIADNDDVPGSGTTRARIEALVIEEPGTYVIVATRYGQAAGDSVGGFVLTLNEAQNSGLGNSLQAPFPLQMNQYVEGDITNRRYQKYYTFQARRDDLITIKMDWVSGRIDSYLILTNAVLQPLIENDDGGNNQNAAIENYRIPADGTYFIIATRFEGEAGTTEGGYRLQLEYHGNAFDGVPPEIPRMYYGTTATGSIDGATPELFYAFWGRAGDPISISMQRSDGDLDPVVEVLNQNRERLVRNDDGGDGQNARIERYVLQRTGLYYIRATRYSGEDGNAHTQGSFLLVLAQRFD